MKVGRNGWWGREIDEPASGGRAGRGVAGLASDGLPGGRRGGRRQHRGLRFLRWHWRSHPGRLRRWWHPCRRQRWWRRRRLHRSREPAHRGRHVGPRGQPCDEGLDFPLAPPLRHRHERIEVVGTEMRGEQPHRAEVQGPIGQQVEDGGNPTTRAGGFDAIVGSVLGEPERSRAVAEERAEALAGVEPSGVELGQVSDELDGGRPVPAWRERRRGGASPRRTAGPQRRAVCPASGPLPPSRVVSSVLWCRSSLSS